MRRFIQCICFVLVIAMFLPVSAMAVEAPNPRGSDYFMKYSCYLWEVSDTQFQIWFDITALDIMDELGSSEITLYRSSDQINWTPVKTYTKSNYSQMIGTNELRYANCVSYNYTSGYYYADVKFYAKKGSGSSTMTISTPIEAF